MWLALDHELRGRRSLWDHLDPDGHLEALNQRLKTSVRAAKLHGHPLETEAWSTILAYLASIGMHLEGESMRIG